MRRRWGSLPRLLLVLVLARSVNRLGAFSLPFLSVTLTRELGADLSTVGIVLSLFGLATIPSRLLGGQLADSVGRRPTIVIGLLGCALAQLWIAAAHSLLAITLAVIGLGLVFELYEPPSQALLVDLARPDERPAAFGLLAAGMAAAGMLSGLCAAELSGLSLRWLFVADAATCVACAGLVQVGLPSGSPSRERRADSSASPWRDSGLLAMLASGTLFATIYLQITVGLPLTLTLRGLPVSYVGLLLTLSAATIVAGQPLLRARFAARFAGLRAMAAGYAVLGVGLAGMGFAVSLREFAVCTVVWSLGDLLLLGHAYGIVAAIAPDSPRARYLAAYGVSWGLAAIAAPLLGTLLLARGGAALLWLSCAGVAGALAASTPVVRLLCEARPLPPMRKELADAGGGQTLDHPR